ncbi:cytochrome P450 9e2-like [Malaya genurostris]|uniref:cytochrome P450 9e2-like n=1 Tax=Malaya genurostris TaxID=325434 RepID=UPI0026F3FF33|nr:cytochrome P450 9e2-like [Malaya genurostris]XP_058462576.1 cytochrome P450 9e2-like [Malaya genurostris]
MEVDLVHVLAVVTIIGWFYHWLTKNLDYFHDKPIPSMAVKPIVGSTGSMLFKKTSFTEFIKRAYDKFEGVKVFGLFDANLPFFVIRDPELIKTIGIKDFEYFINHRPIFGKNDSDHPDVIFAKSLFVLNDQKWKNMRITLSPAFTGSKMRQMFELIVDCCESTASFYRDECKSTKLPLVYEMKDVFSRFGNDVIASCAFGMKIDSFRNRENQFFCHGKDMFKFNTVKAMLRTFGFRFIPTIMSYLGIDFIEHKHNAYFSALIKNAVNLRETQGIFRPDMVHLLMQARKGTLKHQHEKFQKEGFATVEESDMGKGDTLHSMTEVEMIAQCLIFFLAGFDTVSTNLTFLSYELTINPDVQKKLYEEIVATHRSLKGSPLNYDTLQKMQYMDMVVCESLRMWPPVPAVDRLCVRNYELDDGAGLKFTIEKGTAVFFPVQGLHYDPKYFPNPEKFVPERFSDENNENIRLGTYLPFGIGPRNCIASRFALMEVKAIMYHMLLHFSFERTEKTQVPLQLAKGYIGLHSKAGLFVELKPRSHVTVGE